MSRQRRSDSWKVFEANLDRSRAFLRIFDKDRGRGRPSNDEKELLRGCLVFAIGALDAYLSDLILEIVPQHGAKSRSLDAALNQIAKANPGIVLRLTLAEDSQTRREEFRHALGEWLDSKSFQGPEKVRIAMDYLGLDIAWSDFDADTGMNTQSELARVTKDRHEIVHSGKKPYIKRDLAGATVDLIASMGALIDSHTMAAVAS